MRQHDIPIIELWGHLLVPLQGDISDTQIERLQEAVLHRIRERGTDGLVIDASGVSLMDSHLCAVLGRLATAARLMGARPVLSGLGPGVVSTLQEMGIELPGIEAAMSLEDALEELGLRVLLPPDETSELTEFFAGADQGRAQ